MLFFHPWRISPSPNNTERWFRIANAPHIGYNKGIVRVEVIKSIDGIVFVSGYDLLVIEINARCFPYTKTTEEQKLRVDAKLIERGHILCASQADAEKFEILQ